MLRLFFCVFIFGEFDCGGVCFSYFFGRCLIKGRGEFRLAKACEIVLGMWGEY